jgi:hypothetical protein
VDNHELIMEKSQQHFEKQRPKFDSESQLGSMAGSTKAFQPGKIMLRPLLSNAFMSSQAHTEVVMGEQQSVHQMNIDSKSDKLMINTTRSECVWN